jgi:type IV pilus assembly protein PilA
VFSSTINRLNERRTVGLEGQEADAGFTLIELMVVLLILAILLAIAIPTFLGVTGSANDRAAQSNLNTAITSGKGVYESLQQTYPTTANTLALSIAANEPSLAIQTTTTTAGQGQIVTYVSPDGNGVIYMSLAKKTGNCWFLADNTSTISPVLPATTDPPWKTGTTIGTGIGIPATSGEIYGVYVSLPTNARTCDPATLGALTQAAGTLTESSTAFPSNP